MSLRLELLCSYIDTPRAEQLIAAYWPKLTAYEADINV